MFSVKYEELENIMIVKLDGELMLDQIDKLKSEFNEFRNSHNYFVFDFDNVSMIDSSGLGFVVYCLKKLKEDGGDIKIANLKDQASLIFEITRINSILDIYDSQEAAINSIQAMENKNESNSSYRQEVSA